jgi:type II secretory pathway pseudopilin PulG
LAIDQNVLGGNMFGAFKGNSRNLKDSLPILFLEVILIFLSVFLAFSLGEWQQKRTKQKTAELALNNIRSEIQRNRDEVEPLIEFHKNLILKTRQVPDSIWNNNSAFGIILFALENKSPQMPLLDNSVWSAAVSSGAVQNMNFELLTEISFLYNAQENGLTNQINKFINLIGNPATFDPDQALENIKAFQMLMQSIYGSEVGYVDKCDSLIVQIDKSMN